MSLTNEANWINIHDQRYEDQSRPLGLVQIPQTFYKHTIRILVTTFADIPKGYYRAGYLTHRLNDFTSTVPWVGESLVVPINRMQLIRLQNFTPEFWLEFQPLRRFIWVNVKIDFYTLEN